MHHIIEFLAGNPSKYKMEIPYSLYQFMWNNVSKWKRLTLYWANMGERKPVRYSINVTKHALETGTALYIYNVLVPQACIISWYCPWVNVNNDNKHNLVQFTENPNYALSNCRTLIIITVVRLWTSSLATCCFTTHHSCALVILHGLSYNMWKCRLIKFINPRIRNRCQAITVVIIGNWSLFTLPYLDYENPYLDYNNP